MESGGERHERSAQAVSQDTVTDAIADYVCAPSAANETARRSARYCLCDALACALMARSSEACMRLVGPLVPGAVLDPGARVPGTRWQLDPVQAAFCTGSMIRWLDFNDTWLAAEWGHPSDNLGAILCVCDYLARQAAAARRNPLRIRDLLDVLVKAYEIQGVLALENGFNRVGLDHVLLVRVASAAVAALLLGAERNRVACAVSNAWVDGGALRLYRHAGNAGCRKSWAAGDATARGVRLALLAVREVDGYSQALSAADWGFSEVLFNGREIRLARPLGSYVVENILFKIAYPAEFHGQTAVESALLLHEQVCDRLERVERVEVHTQQAAMRIIDRTGPLSGPTDRDHCLQYMVAVALVFGRVGEYSYADPVARDPRVDRLREKIRVIEDPRYSADYLHADKRSIANRVQVFFRDGGATPVIEIEYPLGHRKRREEGLPLLRHKFCTSVTENLPPIQAEKLIELRDCPERFDNTPVHEWMDLSVPAGPV